MTTPKQEAQRTPLERELLKALQDIAQMSRDGHRGNAATAKLTLGMMASVAEGAISRARTTEGATP